MLIQLLNGEDYYFINYYNYATDRANGGYFFSKKIGEKIVRYQTGDDIIESTLEIEDMKNNGKENDINSYLVRQGTFTGLNVTYDGVTIEDKEAKEYYIKAYYFSKWVQNNLSDVKASNAVSTKDDDSNSYAYADFTGDESQIFDIEGNAENNPENINSLFVKHKQDIIKNSIQYNLNLAISTYNENHNMDISSGQGYVLPVLSTEDWTNVLNNICMVSFMQGIPCGTTTFNNYAVVKSNNNNTSASLENIYFTEEINNKDKQYHKIDCVQLGNIESYNNSDTYQADQSAEFKYDAHKINTKIEDVNDETILAFYDDTTNKYYETKNLNGIPTSGTSGNDINSLTIGDEITDQARITDLSKKPTGSEVKYIYDHQNPGCYDCVIAGNYTPAVKEYNGNIYQTYKTTRDELIIKIDDTTYLNLDGTQYKGDTTGAQPLINEAEFRKRKKSVYTYLAKIRNSLYKTNSYVNR